MKAIRSLSARIHWNRRMYILRDFMGNSRKIAWEPVRFVAMTPAPASYCRTRWWGQKLRVSARIVFRLLRLELRM